MWVPIIRIIVFWGYIGFPYFGKVPQLMISISSIQNPEHLRYLAKTPDSSVRQPWPLLVFLHGAGERALADIKLGWVQDNGKGTGNYYNNKENKLETIRILGVI